MKDRKYFIYNSGLPLPAYSEGYFNYLFSIGNIFEFFNDPERWAMNAEEVSKTEFDALLEKASDPMYGKH